VQYGIVQVYVLYYCIDADDSSDLEAPMMQLEMFIQPLLAITFSPLLLGVINRVRPFLRPARAASFAAVLRPLAAAA
jgi:hypothetical protein